MSGNVPIDNSSFFITQAIRMYLNFIMIQTQDQPAGCFTSQTTTSAKRTTTTSTTTTSTTTTTTTSTSTTTTSTTTTTSIAERSTASTITTTIMDPNRNAVLVLSKDYSEFGSNNKPFIVDFNGKYFMFFHEC